jgi:hypothetical protein
MNNFIAIIFVTVICSCNSSRNKSDFVKSNRESRTYEGLVRDFFGQYDNIDSEYNKLFTRYKQFDLDSVSRLTYFPDIMLEEPSFPYFFVFEKDGKFSVVYNIRQMRRLSYEKHCYHKLMDTLKAKNIAYSKRATKDMLSIRTFERDSTYFDLKKLKQIGIHSKSELLNYISNYTDSLSGIFVDYFEENNLDIVINKHFSKHECDYRLINKLIIMSDIYPRLDFFLQEYSSDGLLTYSFDVTNKELNSNYIMDINDFINYKKYLCSTRYKFADSLTNYKSYSISKKIDRLIQMDYSKVVSNGGAYSEIDYIREVKTSYFYPNLVPVLYRITLLSYGHRLMYVVEEV